MNQYLAAGSKEWLERYTDLVTRRRQRLREGYHAKQKQKAEGGYLFPIPRAKLRIGAEVPTTFQFYKELFKLPSYLSFLFLFTDNQNRELIHKAPRVILRYLESIQYNFFLKIFSDNLDSSIIQLAPESGVGLEYREMKRFLGFWKAKCWILPVVTTWRILHSR